jgi:tetratricopeptide (TPR) repeat protein
MNFFPARCNGAALTLFCLLIAAGCTPPPGTGTASPVERYLKTGQAQAQQNDFDGAQASYEKALAIELNNASVHYQLALLFDSDLNQPEKALYHFTRVLEINPEYRWSDMIKDHLPGLRMRVSSGSIPMVPCPELEKTIVQLHKDLATKNEELQRQANQIEEVRRRYQALTSVSPQTPDTQPRQQPAQTEIYAPQPQVPIQPTPTVQETRVAQSAPTGENSRLQYSPPKQIAYKVQRGDTLYSLGRRYGIGHKEILLANPGLTAETLKIGETIVIPVR